MASPDRTRSRSAYRWYDYFERAWFAAALVAGLLIGLDRLPGAILALLIAGGLLIALLHIVAAIADLVDRGRR